MKYSTNINTLILAIVILLFLQMLFCKWGNGQVYLPQFTYVWSQDS